MLVIKPKVLSYLHMLGRCSTNKTYSQDSCILFFKRLFNIYFVFMGILPACVTFSDFMPHTEKAQRRASELLN